MRVFGIAALLCALAAAAPCDKHTSQCCHHCCKMYVGPCCHHDTSTREICCCGGCKIASRCNCTADYQPAHTTPAPRLPKGADTPDPTCGRGTKVQLNATTSVCCNSSSAAAVIDAAAAVIDAAPPVTCTRSGKAASFNLTEYTGTSISGTLLPYIPTLTAGDCAASCCAADGCVAFTWWADTPGGSHEGCHHGSPCCFRLSTVTAIAHDQPVCPPNPGSHTLCATSGTLDSKPPPTPSGCDPEELAAEGRTCDTHAPPCLMVPLNSTSTLGCMWEDWDACDALDTSSPCPTVSCVLGVSCPASDAMGYPAWGSGEWGNVFAKGWCTGCCATLAQSAGDAIAPEERAELQAFIVAEERAVAF